MRPPRSGLQEQYEGSANLAARSAIYRFAVGGGFGPAQAFDLMLATIPADADVLEVGCGPGGMWSMMASKASRWRRLAMCVECAIMTS